MGRCTLVWGHGLASSIAHEDELGLFDWDAMGTAAEVVRYDARGHGHCEPRYVDRAYCWPALVDDMIQAAGHEGPFVPGGISMGAATALYTALLAPRRVQGLVLVAPPAAWAARRTLAREYAAAADLVERKGLEPFVGMLRQRPASGLVERELSEARDIGVRHLSAMDPRALPAILRGMAASDLPPREQLRNVVVPTLILAWDGDDQHPLSTARALAQTLVLSELVVAEDLDSVRGWPGLIREFLEGLVVWDDVPQG